MSDRIVVMFAGHIHQIGSAQDIYNRPRTKEVAQFIGRANLFAADVEGRDGEGYRLRTTFGSVHATSEATDVTIGGKAWLMVRPESIRLSSGMVEGALAATVEEAVFLGNLTDYRLRLADGTDVDAQAIGELAHAPGSAVSVTFDRNRTWLVR